MICCSLPWPVEDLKVNLLIPEETLDFEGLLESVSQGLSKVIK